MNAKTASDANATEAVFFTFIAETNWYRQG
jgi:hypothetical protein